MGHKINPNIFRVGISVDWKYQLRDPLLANVSIYKTVKNLFSKYSAPYVSNTMRRNGESMNFNIMERKNALIKNLFFRDGFIFSHLNISYAPSLHLNIVLFDTIAEQNRIGKELHEMPSYYLYGNLLLPVYRSYSYFLKNMYKKKGNNPLKPTLATKWFYYKRMLQKACTPIRRKSLFLRSSASIFFIKYIKKTRKFSQRKLRRVKRQLKYQREKKYRLKATIKRLRTIKKISSLRMKAYPAWLINNTWLFTTHYRISDFLINLRICLFLARYLQFYKRIYSKKKLFLFNIFLVTLTTILSFNKGKFTRFWSSLFRNDQRRVVLSRRIFLLLYICHIQLLSHSYLQLQYNKQIFQTRLYTFHLYSRILLFTLRKAIFIPNDRRLIVRYYVMNNLNLNANYLLNYFIVKLGQYFKLNDIMIPIVQRLKRLNDLEGFRLIFSGRLTRKERAAYIVKSHKSMPLSTYKARVDYASDFKILKFGVVGIKIYLLFSAFPPYYYFYEFRSKL
jgi:hypothetical protein